MTLFTEDQLSERDYHATEGVTFHRLKEFQNSGPAWYAGRYVTKIIPPPPDKDWGLLGRAYHILGLQGEEAFNAQVITHPLTYQGKESTKKDAPLIDKPWNWNATACQEWREANRDKLVLSPEDFAAAKAIGRNMRANVHAQRLLRMGWPELTICQDDERFPVPMKGRIDWLSSTSSKMTDAWAICDPKGADDLDGFKRDAIKYGYHRQLAYYRSLVFHEIGKLLPCFLVAVEKKGAHRVRVWQIEDQLLDIATTQNEVALDQLAQHYRFNDWPLDHDDTIRVLSTPEYMLNQDSKPVEAAPWEA